MSEDDRPGPTEPDGARSDDQPARRGAPAPWERPWATSRPPASTPPSTTPPAPAPLAEPPTPAPSDDVEDTASRRALDHQADDQVSVAELLRKVGRTGGARRRRQPEPDDTAVIPAIRDEPAHAPLGGAPEMLRPRPTRPPAATAPAATAFPVNDAVEAQTRLQAKKSLRQRRASLAGKSAVTLVALLVFGVTGAAWGALRYVDANVQVVQALDQGSTAIKEPEKQLGDENFLLVGSDSRAGSSGDIGAGDEDEVGGARSDTTMIAHIPADRSRIVIVSFPRDLQVDLPACEKWDNDTATYSTEVVPPQQGVKLNTAYFEGGPRCTTKVVQQLSGLNVNHFLGVDFSGFQAMVDAVDGVQVCAERPINDSVLGAVLAAGTSTINGQQALNYVRARHVQGDPTSDYGRIQRQQRFLSSLLRKALSQDTLLNFGRLKNLVDAVTSNTFGDNIGAEQLLTLAQSLQGLDAGRVTFITAPTTGEANDAGNEVLLDDENTALFQAIRSGEALPGEAAAAPTTTTPPPATTPAPTTAPPALLALDPSAVDFTVTNATSTAGLAAGAVTALAAYGFTAADTGNLGELLDTTVVRYPAGQEAAARTLASAVPGTGVEASTAVTGVELVLGADFDGTVGAPTAAGSALSGGAAPPTSAAPTTSAPLPGNLAVVNGGDATCS